MSPKNARLKTNGDQSSSARIRTDATLGFSKGKLSIWIRSRGKFTVRCRVKYSFHFEICVVAMAGTSRTRMRTRSKFGINFGATAGTSQILELNSLQFENHLVVELLWPRRERRARMIAVVELDILNLLSTNFQIRIRCRGSSSSLLELTSSRWLVRRGFSHWLN